MLEWYLKKSLERINMPEVSVVIPLYNKGLYIARTLNSVLNQTFQDFEVIIIEGGSTDNGAEIVKGFDDPRIRLIRQKNKGVSEARNQGVEIAKADMITFLDADDEWMASHLETILKLRKRYPEAGMYTTAYKIFTPEGNIRWARYRFIPDPPWEGLLPNYFKSLAYGEYPVWTSVVGIPKKIFLEAGGFPPGYWYGEDVDLFGKIGLKYPVAFSWEQGAIYHWDATNRACNKKLPFELEEPFVKTARNAIDLGEALPEYLEPLNECISKREIFRAAEYVLVGNAITARAILKKCKTKLYYKKKVGWIILSNIPYPLLMLLQKLNRKFSLWSY
jgi:glycosyltransferase involved in cell wall biosynthesis